MLTSYTRLTLYDHTLLLFSKMMATIKPDHYSFTAVLSACAGSCKLRYGQTVHGLVVGLGCCGSVAVSNALIDMYGKCWSVGCANGVFEELGFRNDVSWCSLLFVYVNVNEF
ncbi:pentatricopeptide repeat-containing protein, partial [Tanacetum coccineum]